jgi:septum site-determining protein MinD
MRIIGIVSGKGGVGKTSLVANLSVALVKFNKSVTVVDCNITTSHLAMYFGIYFTSTTLNDVLRNDVSVEQAIYRHFTGVKIIPSSLKLSDIEGVDLSKLNTVINKLPKSDFILLDIAPGFGNEALSAISVARELIIVATPDILSVMDAVRCKDFAEEHGIKILGLVLSKVKNKKYELSIDEIKKLTRLPLLATIPYDKAVEESLTAKMPVVVYKPKSKASREYLKLASDLLGIEFKERKSILVRIFEMIKGVS